MQYSTTHLHINQSQDLDYGNKSEAARFCTDYQSKGFVPDYNAQEALDKILSVVGLAPEGIAEQTKNTVLKKLKDLDCL